MHIKNPAMKAYMMSIVLEGQKKATPDPIGEAAAQAKLKFKSGDDVDDIDALKVKLETATDPGAMAQKKLTQALVKLGNPSERSVRIAVNSGLTDAAKVGEAARKRDATPVPSTVTAKPKKPVSTSTPDASAKVKTLRDRVEDSDGRTLTGVLARWAKPMGTGVADFDWRGYVKSNPAAALGELQRSSHGKAYTPRALSEFLVKFQHDASFGQGAPNRAFQMSGVTQSSPDAWTPLPSDKGSVSGERAQARGKTTTGISANDRTARGEDDAADALARAGLHVRQLGSDTHGSHRPLSDDVHGLSASKIPDFLITDPATGKSHFYDCFTPAGDDVAGIASTLSTKAGKGQARRFVINLDQMTRDVSPAEVAKAIEQAHGSQGFPLQPGEQWCIEEVLVVNKGKAARIYLNPLQPPVPSALTTSPSVPSELSALKLGELGEREFIAAAHRLHQDVTLKGTGLTPQTFSQSLGPVVESAVLPYVRSALLHDDPHAQLVGSVKLVKSTDLHAVTAKAELPKPEIDALAVTSQPLGGHTLHLVSIKKDGDAFSASTDDMHLGLLRGNPPALDGSYKSVWVQYQDLRDGQTKYQPLDTFKRWVGGSEPGHVLSAPSDAQGKAKPDAFIGGPSSTAIRDALVAVVPELAGAFKSTGVWM